MHIILASTSPYRKSLLEKLNIPFTSIAPETDESPYPKEGAEELTKRLAIAKASAISAKSGSYIIGSDQVASVNNSILGKPGNHIKAIEQLKMCSGKTVTFYTGLCLLESETGAYKSLVEKFDVKFKHLTDKQIESYISIEKPFNCAGSFKSEGFGILLFDALNGRDPNTLIGLPLIALNELFLDFGVDLLTRHRAL